MEELEHSPQLRTLDKFLRSIKGGTDNYLQQRGLFLSIVAIYSMHIWSGRAFYIFIATFISMLAIFHQLVWFPFTGN